ncbi:MAG: hypothetical protein F6K39_32205 [Okeania sp. SIO3B3]|nr:hypothetical protein [Okeania sp. SIO3B3]
MPEWLILGFFESDSQLISCSVEYLHSGGRKAAGAEGKKGLKGIKFFYN